MISFARIADGHESWSANARVPRHRHDQAYAAIVLSGFYEECGSLGRFRVGPGDVLLHGRYQSHLDRFGSKGTRILNLVISEADASRCSLGRVADADSIARTAESDAAAARAQFRAQLAGAAHTPGDWPEMLAADLLGNPCLSLGRWAREHGLAAETVSRGFGKLFGVSPAKFRTEARGRRAFAHIARNSESLASIAVTCGFADQAHMSRAVRALTGQPPGRWRTRSAGANPGSLQP